MICIDSRQVGKGTQCRVFIAFSFKYKYSNFELLRFIVIATMMNGITIECHYKVVQYNIILYTALQQLGQNLIRS